MRTNINIFISFLLILGLMSGCDTNQTEEDCCLVMPDGNIEKTASINDFGSKYNLSYEDYQGFVGNLDGEVLQKFTILIEKQSQKVGRDVASEKHIEQLKEEKVVGIRFDKIPNTKMSFDEVIKYITSLYPHLSTKSTQNNEIGIDAEVSFVGENGTIVKVQNSNFGVPGTFVILNCKKCN